MVPLVQYAHLFWRGNLSQFYKGKNVEGEGFEPSKPKQRIYSPSHLTALEPLQHCPILK